MAATVAHCVFPGLDQEEHSAQPCSAAAEERRVRDIHGQHQPRGPALQHRLRARPRRSLSQLPPWTRRSRWTRRLPGGGGAGAWTRGSWRRRRRSTHVPPLARRFGETGQEGWQPDRVGGIYRLEGRADGLVAVVFTHLSFSARGERILVLGSLRTIDPTCALRDVSANGGEASVLFLSRSSCFTIEPLVVGEG
jgi:hypothetical protein